MTITTTTLLFPGSPGPGQHKLQIPVDVLLSSGSCGLIFNKSDLREKMEDGSSGLPEPEPLREGGRARLTLLFLGEDALAMMPWMVESYSRWQLRRAQHAEDTPGKGRQGTNSKK